ncbi:MAG TPA: alpha/beta hydrolase fold domain-containing protein [Solirubrobacterales bacterium]|nr:alpha/beta hydrolase fold domain-containing protein [Solirubrobacterales bacterium]
MSVATIRSRTRSASAPCAALAVVLALLLAAAFGAPVAAAEPPPKPVLLLLHGGGFFTGDPGYMDYAAAIAAEQGEFATLQPSYPLDDLPAAFAQMKGLALSLRRQGRRVFAYGDSAGGGIAAWLASRGYVAAAAAKAPPTALRAWKSAFARYYASAAAGDPHSWRHLHASEADLRTYSSAGRPSLRPLLIFQSCEDRIVPCAMNVGFAERDPRVSLVGIWGAHADPEAKDWSFRRGLAWLAARAAA